MTAAQSNRLFANTLFLACAWFLTACQSYNDQVAELVATYETGDFDAAAEVIASGDLDDAIESETDGVLFMLESAKVLQDAGRYRQSSRMFDRASSRLEQFDLKASVSVSEEFRSTVGTQASREYRGTDYDRILLEVYEVLNYLAVDDFGEAMVHVRRAYRRQSEAVARNAEAIKEREENPDKKQKAVFDSEQYKAYESEIDSLATDAYSDFVNPLATFLSAVLLREEGTNSNALVDLRKLIKMLPGNSYLPPLLEEFEADATPVANRFYVIFENGLAPSRQEWSLTLPTPNGLSRVAVPILRTNKTTVKGLRITARDGSFEIETEHAASMDSIVASDFKVHLPALIWRTVLAQIAKEGTTYALAKNDDSGLVLFFASLFKVATAGADLRTWRTPGSEFQIAYGQVPEDGQLSLDLITDSGVLRGNAFVTLPRARTHFIFIRNPRLSNIQPRIFSLGLEAPTN